MGIPNDQERWWGAPSAAPWAFCCGGLLGALSPFALVYVASLFSSGGNLAREGPKNWADHVLNVCAILSYTGCFALLLMIGAAVVGFLTGGYVVAIAAMSIRRFRRRR